MMRPSRLSFGLGALAVSSLLGAAALAQPVAPTPAPPGSATATTPAPAAPLVPVHPPDVMDRPGYVPGYRRYPSLVLQPNVPNSGVVHGNMAVPYGAPAPRDVWTFNYSGFFAAGARASIRNRELAYVSLAPKQSDLILRNTVDTGGSFSAGGAQGSWVEMKFEYGNRNVTAHVNLTTWNPTRGASFLQLGSQNFIDSAFITARAPQLGKLRLGFSFGAFSVTYGNLGNYGGGFYSNAVGRVSGVGETTSAEYALSDTWIATLDHGLHSSGDRAPGGSHEPVYPVELEQPAPRVECAPQPLGDCYDGLALTHHVHAGVIKNGDLTLRAQLHYLNNFSYDDHGYLAPTERRPGTQSNYDPDPRPETPYIDESIRKDRGRFDVYGATFGFKGLWYQGGVGVLHARAHNAYALHGLNVSYVGDGDQFSNTWVGPRSFDENDDWVGSTWSAAAEAELSWGTLLRQPKPFWGEGTNVTTGLGFQYGRIQSEDDARDGWAMYRAGINVLASLLPWFAVETRLDRVSPNLDRPNQAYYALMTRAVFRTFWTSHESVSLQYNKWIYGSEPPVNFNAPPVEKLDTDVISAGFGMWW